MAGVSLTLSWLDEELEASWSAPALTPAFRRGVVATPAAGIGEVTVAAADEIVVAAASDGSRADGRCLAGLLAAVRTAIDAEADELGRLDAVAGDGDHGIGMQRGAVAAAQTATELVAAQGGARTTLLAAADAWAARGGGTSGALWGIGLRAAGEGLSDIDGVTPEKVAAGVLAARDAIAAAGAVAVGDKTMLDALDPFATALCECVAAGETLTAAWTKAAEAARTAADRTDRLVPRIGRARTHAERSVGTPDPGAVSFAVVVAAVSARMMEGK
jgi:dihydroxyacetone kinase